MLQIAEAVLSFLALDMRYVFPAKTGGLVRGVVTGFAAPGLENLIAETGEPEAVWPSVQGSYRGYSLSPLYHRAPEAVQDDPRFHAYLALVDVLRRASARGREVAVSKLGAMIERDV